ncbi:ABC transporter permease [Mucilaginibacter sp.]
MDFYLTALVQGLCFSGLALGIYLSVKIFNIPDITTDGSYTLGGIITAVLLTKKYSLWLVLPAVVTCGCLAGFVTGLIHTKLKINALLAGILTMTALYSINLIIAGRSNIPLMDTSSVFTAVRTVFSEQMNTLITVSVITGALLTGVGYLLKTDFGLAMRATGNSESMVKALGVNTDRMKITGLALANGLTALSGCLITQLQSFADINMGIGIVIVGLGSVMIAEAVIHASGLSAISLQLLLVIGGAVVFRLILAFVLSLGIDANLLKLVTAVLVLLIVSIPKIKFIRL